MANIVADSGAVKIITQVIQQPVLQPDEAATSVPGSTSVTPLFTPTQFKSLRNTLPKALGVVQIVLGAIQISYGIALTAALAEFKNLSVMSGVYFWIGNMLLISGSLLVEMEKRDLLWLVQSCFAANCIVAVTALAAVIIHTTELVQVVQEGNICEETVQAYVYCSDYHQLLPYGLSSVFIIFSLLEFSIAVTALVATFRSRRQLLYQQMVL